MSTVATRSVGAAVAGGLLAAVTALAGPAYADAASSPFKGRTASGNLIVGSGDVVVCFAENQVVVADTEGRFRQTDGPGTTFTTTAGAEFETLTTSRTFEPLKNGGVEVSFRGASAVVTCPRSLIPLTSTFVPKSTLAGTGGSITAVNLAQAVAGGTLVLAGAVGAALILRRRRGEASREHPE